MKDEDKDDDEKTTNIIKYHSNVFMKIIMKMNDELTQFTCLSFFRIDFIIFDKLINIIILFLMNRIFR